MEASLLIDEDGILERVDEYSLYCHYLEFEPEVQVNYLSPLRNDDENPSFGLYAARRSKTRELLWKDSGGKGERGDIFRLVQLLYGYPTRADAIARVKSDFGLRPGVEAREKLIHHTLKNKEHADIRVVCRSPRDEDLTWWKQWNIGSRQLERYRTSPLYMYWSYPGQKVPAFAPKRAYVYRIYDRYQLYFPQSTKGKKFRSDLREEHVLGMEQLKGKSRTLIITKSMKDVMCLDSYGYEAIAPRSENTPMPSGAFEWISSHYQHVFVLFDNDGKHRAEWYPYPQKEIPISSGNKDISDFTRDHSPAEGRILLHQLFGPPA